MDIRAYLYTVNKNRGYCLSPEELKDAEQEAAIKLFEKSYSDQINKLTLLSVYRSAVNDKMRQGIGTTQQSDLILDPEETTELEIQQSREKRIAQLELSSIQKKIIKALVSGYSYEEIRKKYKLSQRQVINHCQVIKKKNS